MIFYRPKNEVKLRCCTKSVSMGQKWYTISFFLLSWSNPRHEIRFGCRESEKCKFTSSQGTLSQEMRVDRRKRRQKSGFIGLCVKTFLCKCFSVCVAFVCATSICVWIKELCLKDFVCTSFCVQPCVKVSCVNAFVCTGDCVKVFER